MSHYLITVKDIVTRFGKNIVHDGVTFNIKEGEIFGLVGGSGSGKSTLLKEMIMLLKPQSGAITVLDKTLSNISFDDAQELRKQWGVLFQSGALFSSLSVEENVAVSLREYTKLDDSLIKDIVEAKVSMVGLPKYALQLYPAELSGGMKKRAALARALVMDPKLLFLDEPTSGLDPVGSQEFDKLIVDLRDLLGLSVVMVTHDIDSIFTIIDRFAVLGDKKVIVEGTLEDVLATNHEFIEKFFKGERAKHRMRF